MASYGKFEGADGLFNEAALKMRRVDDKWRFIEHLRINLLDFNYDYQKYNYEIIISELIGQCQEVMDLMAAKERETFAKFREYLTDFLETTPIFTNTTNYSMSSRKKTKEFDSINWKRLKKLIFAFEDFTRQMLGYHGLSNPIKKDPTKAAIDF